MQQSEKEEELKKEIFKISENDIAAKDVVALNSLLKQLNSEASSIDMIELAEVTSHGGIIITVRDIAKDNLLIGMGTLVPIRKLFAFCGTIEDIIVDEDYRRRGLGRKITDSLIEKSRQLKMKFIDLTSRPERIAANELYQSVGFKKRETNLYRLYN